VCIGLPSHVEDNMKDTATYDVVDIYCRCGPVSGLTLKTCFPVTRQVDKGLAGGGAGGLGAGPGL